MLLCSLQKAVVDVMNDFPIILYTVVHLCSLKWR